MNFEGKLIGTDLKVAIVVSRFNDFITNRLLDGAKDTLIRHEVPVYISLWYFVSN